MLSVLNISDSDTMGVDNNIYSFFFFLKHIIIFILWLWLLTQLNKILLQVQFGKLGKARAAVVSAETGIRKGLKHHKITAE